MYSILLEERVLKILRDVKRYPAKLHRQITLKIFLLQANPRPQDCKKVGIGYRVDVGEHRILYTVDNEERIVRVELVGPRNDEEVYRLVRRLGLI
ncbi:MAG TPA: type II toxin-antitoxin system RelE/ParE family toxin [Anaerolineae bacterium]|nr:type II toxin-antitoxin system RelE/ParE family toxin [Anaerolineae bacterium]